MILNQKKVSTTQSVYVRKTVAEIAVASAELSFNDGGKGVLSVFKNLGLNAGYFTICYWLKRNTYIKNEHKGSDW